MSTLLKSLLSCIFCKKDLKTPSRSNGKNYVTLRLHPASAPATAFPFLNAAGVVPPTAFNPAGAVFGTGPAGMYGVGAPAAPGAPGSNMSSGQQPKQATLAQQHLASTSHQEPASAATDHLHQHQQFMASSQLPGATGTTMNGNNDSSMSGNPFHGSVGLTNNATTAGTMNYGNLHDTTSGSIGTMGLTKSGLANYNANHYHQHNSHNMLHGQHTNGYGSTSTSAGLEKQQINHLGGPNSNNRSTTTANAMLTGGPSVASQSASAMAIGMLNNAGQHQHLSSQMHMPSSTNNNNFASKDSMTMQQQQQGGSKLPNGNGSPTQRMEQQLAAQDRGASAQQLVQEKWYEVKWRNYQNDPGVPAEPHMFIDPNKPRKQ